MPESEAMDDGTDSRREEPIRRTWRQILPKVLRLRVDLKVRNSRCSPPFGYF
jgi:hypothetical protein